MTMISCGRTGSAFKDCRWWMYNGWGFLIPHSKVFEWQHDFCSAGCFNPWSRLTLMSPDPWGWQLKSTNTARPRWSEETQRCWRGENRAEGEHAGTQEFPPRPEDAEAGSSNQQEFRAEETLHRVHMETCYSRFGFLATKRWAEKLAVARIYAVTLEGNDVMAPLVGFELESLLLSFSMRPHIVFLFIFEAYFY